MHIEFVRSGGFAGMRLTTSVDTDQLPTERASALDKLIADANFFELPEQLLPAGPAPDRFQYKLTVTAPQKNHSVVVSDAVAPETLRPLLDYLTTLAMVSKKP